MEEKVVTNCEICGRNLSTKTMKAKFTICTKCRIMRCSKCGKEISYYGSKSGLCRKCSYAAGGGFKGKKHTPEALLKQRVNQTGRQVSGETRKKLQEAYKKRWSYKKRKLLIYLNKIKKFLLFWRQ
jgi:hypothetical protein